MKKELVIFETIDKEISLSVEILENTVWLTQNQMAELFKTTKQNISLHANNCFKEGELDKKSVVKESLTTAADGKNYKTKLYNLDVIISVGYRVKSKRGVEFRQWANEILKQYILKGYVVNKKRLQALEKTVDIQTKMLANALDVEESDILKAVNEYTDALLLLDQYDHQTLKKPSGKMPTYRITYDECVTMVNNMRDSFNTDVFGVEKEAGKVKGIIAAIYQSAFGYDAYPSLEEKAAYLLYFMIKDHPYADGCKRIAASLFLEFLDRNNVLFVNGEKKISDGALVAITLMIAESRPEEKDVMVTLVMNLLK
ncbi:MULTISPECIES: RhuM family protein [unclassified Blautia]|jgi:prophage maintenance system killer protein|uniref:RhuM family protein n=1 Tax=unclassified Blautia TaxID=2648079 RepID=UPI001FD36AEF|nr:MULTISPECIES: RhuM family protein [unclassified Blautia]MCJ7861916.1 virulence RhuM family protein [Blautia sp. NSJ-157]MCJ7865259.1 virulence RhuM family protein [Blautia sp. NSJ-140]